MRLKLISMIGLICIVNSIQLFAQDITTKTVTSGGATIQIQSGDPNKPIVVNIGDSKKKQKSDTTKTELRLLIKFKSEPLARINEGNAQSLKSNLENDHNKFKTELQRFLQTSARSSNSTKILFEYKQVYNGYSLITSQEIKEKLKSLPYVESVTEDQEVKVDDIISNHIIGADRVWSDFNITGRGVRIGIIDTGIDYNHPDLGEGFGPSYKVIGGYDFVNNDADPIDDHGHGTHVAGIAAANGSIKGVAPDAKLVAYKVLNASGAGYDSWILAAIERSVDPDQNPSTADALDVVNMSIGRNTDPNEPYSEAIANATLQGVTYVVAAGNGGATNFGYKTISTPGVAESAITVGATDSLDMFADFSSKGPTEFEYNIKPDVCAPGVAIKSTFLNGSYKTLSGTSMATPQVTGAVALMLEKNPTWTPKIIKASLMHTAVNLPYNLWTQGAGRINVFNAIQQDVVMTPGSISLGFFDKTSDYWTKTVSVPVQNLSNQTKNISFSMEGGITVPGIENSISPSSLVLAPMQSSNIKVTITVPRPSSLPPLYFNVGYFGKLVASYDGKEIKNNISFVNPNQMKINMTGNLPSFVVFECVQNSFYGGVSPTSSPIVFDLPQDTYNISSVYYPNYYVIREGLSNEWEITLDRSQATNHIAFEPKNENGDNIPINNHKGSVSTSSTSLQSVYTYLTDIYMSNSQLNKLDFCLTDTLRTNSNSLYNICATTQRGISTSKTVSNNPSEFTNVNLVMPEEEYQMTYYWLFGFVLNDLGVRSPIHVSSPFNLKLSQNENIDQNVWVKLQSVSAPEVTWQSSPISAVEPNKLQFSNVGSYIPFDSLSNVNEFDYNLGQGLLLWNGHIFNSKKLFNDNNEIYISGAIGNDLFKYCYGENQNATIKYSLTSDRNILAEGSIKNQQTGDPYQSGLIFSYAEAVPYQLELNYAKNNVAGITGSANVKLEFNLSNIDYRPPMLSHLILKENGVSRNSMHSNIPATLQFRFVDKLCLNNCTGPGISEIDSSFVYIKNSTSKIWIRIPTTLSNETHTTSLFGLSPGYYDIRLSSSDHAGNKTNYELTPAFVVIDSGPALFEPVSLLTPGNSSTNISLQSTFKWSKVPALTYTIQVSKTQNFSSIEIENTTTDTTYTVSSSLNYSTTYYWRVKANYAGGQIAWSQTFSFETEQLPPVTLISPIDGQINTPLQTMFEWNESELARSYTIQVSLTSHFQFILINQMVHEPRYKLSFSLNPLTNYYWRVKANSILGSSLWSPVFSFTTTQSGGDGGGDEISAARAFPNPFSGSTTIEFFTETPAEISFVISDMQGNIVDQFVKNFANAGKQSVIWTDHRSGPSLYICKIINGSKIEEVKLIREK